MPATLVAVAVKAYVPPASALLVICQLPPLLATSVPTEVAPANSSTLAPATALPEKVGVLSDVMLSVDEGPVSLAATRSGAEGAGGTAVSIVTGSPPDTGEGPLPAASVWTAVNV